MVATLKLGWHGNVVLAGVTCLRHDRSAEGQLVSLYDHNV